jgi:hypothetical protein
MTCSLVDTSISIRWALGQPVIYVVARIYVERLYLSFTHRLQTGENGLLSFQQCETQHSIQKNKNRFGSQHAQCSCGLR